jgi:anti-anti-sigma factor
VPEILDRRVPVDVISLAGELDLVTAPALRAQLMSAATTTSAGVLMLDLSRVRFLDAQCAGIIAAAAETARCRGARLRVDGLHGMPRKVFDLLGLTWLLGGGEGNPG